ncbi:hypothetical protein N9954_06840 [Maribacter sp.]|nr:hypothetical protein [Maribacter sp.]
MILRKRHVIVKTVKPFSIVEKLSRRFKSKITAATKRAGRNDAVNAPRQDDELTTLAFYIENRNASMAALSDSGKVLVGYLEAGLAEFQQGVNKLIGLSGITSFQQRKREEIEQRDKEIQELANEYPEKKRIAEAKVEEKRKELKIAIEDLDDCKQYKIQAAIGTAISIILLIATSDVAYVAKGFELTGLSFFEQYLVAFATCLSTVMLGVGFVSVLMKKRARTIQILSALGCVALAIGVYYIIGSLRVTLTETIIADSDATYSTITALDFTVINGSFFFAVVLTHLFIFPSKKAIKHRNKYKAAKTIKNTKTKELKVLEKLVNDLLDELIKEKNKIYQAHQITIKGIEKEALECQEYTNEKMTQFNATLGGANEVYAAYNAFHKVCLGAYIARINRYRTDYLTYKMPAHIPDLPNPYGGYTYLNFNINLAVMEDQFLNPSFS